MHEGKGENVFFLDYFFGGVGGGGIKKEGTPTTRSSAPCRKYKASPSLLFSCPVAEANA